MKLRSLVVGCFVVTLVTVFVGVGLDAQTTVRGHQKARSDRNGNGIPDAGVFVVGKYESLYAYDQSGNYYWDLGDGRVLGTVASVDALDSDTLTSCRYENVYRADFGDTPFMDEGWIINAINCTGMDKGSYLFQIVSQSDPRYTGNPDWAVWGTWEYHVLVESGNGNLVRPFSEPRNHIGG